MGGSHGINEKSGKNEGQTSGISKEADRERGFDRVSVEDITRDSGVAKGTFYHYFKCKEDVVAELSF